MLHDIIGHIYTQRIQSMEKLWSTRQWRILTIKITSPKTAVIFNFYQKALAIK